MPEPAVPVVAARGLAKHYPITRGVLVRRELGRVRAVDGLEFAVPAGRTFAIVGESGCGKTTTARMMLRLETPTAGQIVFEGRDVNEPGLADRYRRSVQAVFQDPYSSLNPRMRVAAIVAEPLRAAGDMAEAPARIAAALDSVGLGAEAAQRFPHMFSGGQRQRIAIARAIVCRPRLIVLDEPVSALDVSIRAQILNLLKDLQDDSNVAYLMISHDLATVRFIAHTVGVMYLGRFAEVGPAERIFSTPRHPYTQSLVAAASARRQAVAVAATDLGEVPSAANLPAGCRFHPRCLRATELCRREQPELRPVGGVEVACHHPLEEAA